MGITNVGCITLGKNGESIIDLINFHRMRLLGHVLRMSNRRLRLYVVMTDVDVSLKKLGLANIFFYLIMLLY